jgi:PEGA domain
MKKLLLVFTALLMTLPVSAAGRFIRGGFGYGPAYGAGGYFGGPGYYAPYAFGTPNAGELKLNTNLKDAEVFINGAFAGTAGKLKSMYLRPGAYNIELRAPGRTRYAERVYIVAGKTLHVHPDLRVEAR